jgi:hypothetical protein
MGMEINGGENTVYGHRQLEYFFQVGVLKLI